MAIRGASSNRTTSRLPYGEQCLQGCIVRDRRGRGHSADKVGEATEPAIGQEREVKERAVEELHRQQLRHGCKQKTQSDQPARIHGHADHSRRQQTGDADGQTPVGLQILVVVEDVPPLDVIEGQQRREDQPVGGLPQAAPVENAGHADDEDDLAKRPACGQIQHDRQDCHQSDQLGELRFGEKRIQPGPRSDRELWGPHGRSLDADAINTFASSVVSG